MLPASLIQISLHFKDIFQLFFCRFSVSKAHLKLAFVDLICIFHSFKAPALAAAVTLQLHTQSALLGVRRAPPPTHTHLRVQTMMNPISKSILTHACRQFWIASNKLEEEHGPNIYASNAATNGSNNQPPV